MFGFSPAALIKSGKDWFKERMKKLNLYPEKIAEEVAIVEKDLAPLLSLITPEDYTKLARKAAQVINAELGNRFSADQLVVLEQSVSRVVKVALPEVAHFIEQAPHIAE